MAPARNTSTRVPIDGPGLSRRTFVNCLSRAFLAGSMISWDRRALAAQARRRPLRTFVDWFSDAVLTREEVDRFLDPTAKVWARFDPELGYTLRDSELRDGMDGALTFGSYATSGERSLVNFASRECRINTYGNSFTQCLQVSDGETWQETLAAHFGEPIRNFGIGGYGVYQAYRRLLRVEKTEASEPYLILNLYGDDHVRSLMSCRWISMCRFFSGPMRSLMWHGNPWAHARIDPATDRLVEFPNPFPRPEALYDLCDARRLYDNFHRDVVVQLTAAAQGVEIELKPLAQLAEALGLKLDWTRPENLRLNASRLLNVYGWRTSKAILRKLKQFALDQKKKLFIILTYPEESVEKVCQGIDRDSPQYLDWHPRDFRDFLGTLQVPVIDMLAKHLEDFRDSRLGASEYVRRHYIGHYNPHGNHFLAFAVKDDLVRWLTPKPPLYREGGEPIVYQG